MAIEKNLLSELHLIYPPFTNQEGEWLWKDTEVREYVKTSKLYMIVQREELFFKEYEFIPESHGIIKFKLQMGDKITPFIKLDLKREIQYLCENDIEMEFELGDRLIRITDCTNDKVISWFTPNKFLFDYCRKKVKTTIDGTFNHREFTKYDLHYVGISKVNDSFSRLFENAHHGRLRVLSNEYPRNNTSRVTDEVLLLLFDIEQININSASYTDNIEEWLNYTTDNIKVIADAEKAFVSLLDTQYNEVKFAQYPVGEDGLFGQGLDRYSYSISEDISLITETTVFNGDCNPAVPRDCILVEGNIATLIKLT